MLVEYFVNKHAVRNDRAISAVEDGVVSWLQEYPWPGNVRELENTIERAVVLTTGSVIRRDAVTVEAAAPQPASIPSLKLRQNIEWIECETIRRALEASPVKRDAARTMGISPRALSHYLAKYPSIRFGGQHHARMADTIDPAAAASNP
jgi:transcriptional regulator with PAS, ATPase and Fis domain